MANRLTNCVALGIRDRDAAVAFYRDVLGFAVCRETEDWVELDAGGLRIFLCEDAVPEAYFELSVPDPKAEWARLLACGFTPIEFEGSDELFARDPFGYAYCISQAPDET